MKTLQILPAAALAALLVAAPPVTAQPGQGPGAGPGASAPGGGHGRMMGRWGADVTPGWAMMTPEERQAHQDRMAGAKTREECVAEMERHRAQMQERAKARGTTMPTPRRDACSGWK
jgi:hypothetical protein